MVDAITRYNEFIEDNLYKRYPFMENPKGTDGFKLPDSFIADIKITISSMDRAGEESYRYSVYVSKVTVYPDYVYVEFSDSVTSKVIARTDPIRMSLSLADTTDERTIIIRPTSNLPLNGTLVVGTCADLHTMKGVHIMDSDSATVFPSNVLPLMGNIGVLSLAVGDNVATGDVIIEAGKHIDLEYIEDTNTIKISVNPDKDSGINLTSEDIIAALKEKYGAPILSINGVTPDTEGKIDILPTDCFMVTTDNSNNSISFYNPCAPACASYEFINESLRRIKELNDAIDLLRSYYESTANTLAQMGVRVSAVLESRKNNSEDT